VCPDGGVGESTTGFGEVSGYFPEFGGLWVECVEEGSPGMITVCGKAGRENPSKKSVDQVGGRCTRSLETVNVVVFKFHDAGEGSLESESVMVRCNDRNG
jgi:hypothetical protein